MSYIDGWAAMNLEMPGRVPRVEFDAENHWPLVRTVTGIDVGVGSPETVKQQARLAFMRRWHYDVVFNSSLGPDFLEAVRTYMGHSEYAAGGVDRDDRVACPFKSTEEVFAFDPWEAYGSFSHSELVRRFNDSYRAQ